MRARISMIVFGLLLGVIIVWLGGFIFFAWNALAMKPGQAGVKTDAIVVLTGGEDRIETGLQLYAQGAAPYLFISGVHQDVTSVKMMRSNKNYQLLASCCVTLGREATSTIENATETKAWLNKMHFTSIRLVTANYHMERALMEFDHAVPGVAIIPHPVMQSNLRHDHFKMLDLLLSEYHKCLYRQGVFLAEALKGYFS